MSQSSFYLGYFGLKERPFTLVPDPGFLYWSPQHKRAYAVLEYGVLSRAPITLLTGEVGSGKTTLLQNLLGQIEEDVIVGLVSNAQGNRGELLQWVLNAVDVPIESEATYVQNFQKLQEFLIEQYAQGRRVVLVFDEAQNISREGLEELRMLTNINANKDELVQLILVGQPELRDMVRHPSMSQLAQRVSSSFHLNRMSAEVTQGYIRHRLKTAGGTGDEFTAGACLLVHDVTGGVPRLVNQLCDFALLYGWSEDTGTTVSGGMVQSVIDDGVFFCEQTIEREAQA
ncbi:ExeA family protein [Sedimentitalea sp. HM32M-2]|uniref:ExeA family protein n=1 Tax=Sedimentitalea sp. HM32M-2 TaxID=3351566 RepID=UPI00363F0E7F